jgi:hypothetical protein
MGGQAQIISDARAKEIAQSLDADAWTPMVKFATTGEITAEHAGQSADAVAWGLRRLPGESDHLWEKRRDLWDLKRYIAHHGERGPVDGWEAL